MGFIGPGSPVVGLNTSTPTAQPTRSARTQPASRIARKNEAVFSTSQWQASVISVTFDRMAADCSVTLHQRL